MKSLPENDFLAPFQQKPLVYIFKKFPAVAGITTRSFGDFQTEKKGNPREKRNNLILQEMFACGSYHKLHVAHKDKIDLVSVYNHKSKIHDETDAIIFAPNIHGQKISLSDYHVLLASPTADCAIVCLTDEKKNFSAVIHSGSKGIRLNIVGKTIHEIETKLNIKSGSLVAAVWPGIHQNNYEFGPEVFDFAPTKFIKIIKNKEGTHYFLSQKGAVCDQLAKAGLQTKNIITVPDNFNYFDWEFDGKTMLFSHRLGDAQRNCVFIAI